MSVEHIASRVLFCMNLFIDRGALSREKAILASDVAQAFLLDGYTADDCFGCISSGINRGVIRTIPSDDEKEMRLYMDFAHAVRLRQQERAAPGPN